MQIPRVRSVEDCESSEAIRASERVTKGTFGTRIFIYLYACGRIRGQYEKEVFYGTERSGLRRGQIL